MIQHRDNIVAQRRAAVLWLAAALLYLGGGLAAADAFSPPYSYARNYISDIGVTGRGVVLEGRPIWSPLHAAEFTLALAGVDPSVLAVEALDHLSTTRVLLIEGLRLRDGAGTHDGSADPMVWRSFIIMVPSSERPDHGATALKRR